MATPTAAAMLESRVFKNTYGAKKLIITDSSATVYFQFQSSSYQTDKFRKRIQPVLPLSYNFNDS